MKKTDTKIILIHKNKNFVIFTYMDRITKQCTKGNKAQKKNIIFSYLYMEAKNLLSQKYKIQSCISESKKIRGREGHGRRIINGFQSVTG